MRRGFCEKAFPILPLPCPDRPAIIPPLPQCNLHLFTGRAFISSRAAGRVDKNRASGSLISSESLRMGKTPITLSLLFLVAWSLPAQITVPCPCALGISEQSAAIEPAGRRCSCDAPCHCHAGPAICAIACSHAEPEPRPLSTTPGCDGRPRGCPCPLNCACRSPAGSDAATTRDSEASEPRFTIRPARLPVLSRPRLDNTPILGRLAAGFECGQRPLAAVRRCALLCRFTT